VPRLVCSGTKLPHSSDIQVLRIKHNASSTRTPSFCTIMQVLKTEHEANKTEVADARVEKLAAAKKVSDAVAERDLARQMLKGVQAMLGHAEAARSSAQRALQQAQAEKASSQVCSAFDMRHNHRCTGDLRVRCEHLQ